MLRFIVMYGNVRIINRRWLDTEFYNQTENIEDFLFDDVSMKIFRSLFLIGIATP